MQHTKHKHGQNLNLDYIATIWDPHKQCNMMRLEAVQCRSARYVCNIFRNTGVTEMITEQNWQTLDRSQAKMIAAMMCLYHLWQFSNSHQTLSTVQCATCPKTEHR